METKLRQRIIYRDGRRCRYCGEGDLNLLEVHQIVSPDMGRRVNLGSEWLNQPANLITLCRERHDQAFMTLAKTEVLSKREERELARISREATGLDPKRGRVVPNPVARAELHRTRRALLERQDQIRALGRFRLESRQREVAELCDSHRPA